MQRMSRPIWRFFVLCFCLAACAPDLRSAHAIRTLDMPSAKRQVRVDIERGIVGVREAALRLRRAFTFSTAGGFVAVEARPTPKERAANTVDQVSVRIAQIRRQLQRFRQPPRGIPELMISPMSFVCAVSASGIVLARDAEQDSMAGMDVFAAFSEVARAQRDGREWHGMAFFATVADNSVGTRMMLHFAPVLQDQRVVGGILAGTPLWRTAQRITRQFHAEHAAELAHGLVFWAYLYSGGEYHQMGNAVEISSALPSESERTLALAQSPGGFIVHRNQFGRDYAMGVAPLDDIYGPGTGILLVRSDP